MKKWQLIFCAMILGTVMTWGQTSVSGNVIDEDTKEGLIGANVILYQEGKYIEGAITDFDGHYQLAIDPGTYKVEVSYLGYAAKKLSNVEIKKGENKSLDFSLSIGSGIDLDVVVVKSYRKPLVQQSRSYSTGTITSSEIRSMPKRNVRALAAQSAGLSFSNYSNSVSIRGSRSAATHYYVDGIRVRNPQASAYDLEEAFLHGTPAAFEGQPLDQSQSIFPRTFANTKEEEFRPSEMRLPPHTDPISFSEEYQKIVENNFLHSNKEPLSTFSIDVDHAAYSIIRRDIESGRKPAQNVARTEEMVNYFEYDYPEPNGEHPFEVYTELAECPWNSDHHLLHIGLQGEKIDWKDTPGANLVFLIDVSGSMSSANKLELLKPSFRLLVNQLRPEDKVSIVVYAGAAGMVLPPTPGDEKAKILTAISQLQSGGSTAGGAGIQLAYQTAKEQFIEGGNNRVILATDGDFNVGVSSQGSLKKLIEKKRQEKIFLTVLGFGFGNLKDNHLETLADAGNGNYAYIDNLNEAKKVFINEITGTLFTIAKDVKIQLAFNPSTVKSYRLIGYENRLLATEDFADDRKDAGELGAGHSVTAIYEIIPMQEPVNDRFLQICPPQGMSIDPPKNRRLEDSQHLVLVKLRYKKPDESKSKYLERLLNYTPLSLANTSDHFRFSAAVTGFSLILKDSKYKGDLDLEQVTTLAESALGEDFFGYREEFVEMVEAYEDLEIVSTK